MASKRSEKALDETGQPTSKKARRIDDAKGLSGPNLATSKEVAKRAAKYVADFLAHIGVSREELSAKLTVLYHLWNGDSIADYFPTGRQVHVPEPYKAVESFVPRARETLCGRPGWFRVVGIDDSGRDNSEMIEKLLLAQLKRDGFYSKLSMLLRDCAIYGFAPARTRWKPLRRTVKYNEVTATPVEGGAVYGEEKEVIFGKEAEIVEDGPTMEPLDVDDFFCDLRYRSIQEDSPGVAVRQVRFESDIRAMAESGHYVNVNDLLTEKPEREGVDRLAGPPGTAANPATYQDLRNLSDGISMNLNADKDGARQYEVFEFWGKFDPNYIQGRSEQRHEKEYVITLARKVIDNQAKGGWTCLRISENNYWHGQRPVVVAHYTRRSHCFQSVGVIEPIVSLCAELDDSRSMSLAARGLAAKPAFIADDSADIYTPNLILDFGSVIRARSTDSIKALHIPDVSDVAIKAEQNAKQDIREVTGIISNFQGTSDAASETATSVMSRTREANKRIVEVCYNLSTDFLVPMLEQFHAMNQQMMTKERMVELLGEDGLTVELRKVSPHEIAGRVGFEITAVPEVEFTGVKAQMYRQFLNDALPWMQFDPSIVRPAELLKMAYTETFGMANFNRIFPSADAPLKLRSAMDETYMFGMGHEPKVQENENYHEHLKYHVAFSESETFRKWPEDAKRKLWAHIQTTRARLMAETEASTSRLPPEVVEENARVQQMLNPSGAPQGTPAQRGQSKGPVSMEGAVRSEAAKAAPKPPDTGQ
uniref:Putative head tail connector protein n=1 Tax=viral metagenome TaxID=1070528 RepID=A0A6H1ZTG3_9ZZZZ